MLGAVKNTDLKWVIDSRRSLLVVSHADFARNQVGPGS